MRTTFLILALVVCVSGCGGSAGNIESNPDLKDIKNAVSILNDIDVPEEWKKLFVDGAAPDDLKPYDDPIFILPEGTNATFTGDEAEFDVVIVTETGDTDGDGFPDDQETTMTWTAQKVGEKWRLKTAPLP